MDRFQPPDHSEYTEVPCPTCERPVYECDRVNEGCVTCMETCADCGDPSLRSTHVTVNPGISDEKRMCLECALNRRAEIDLAIQQVDDSQAYEGILLANALTIEGLSAQLVSLRAELKQARMTALGLAIGASMTEAA